VGPGRIIYFDDSFNSENVFKNSPHENILVTISIYDFLFQYRIPIPRLATGQAFTCQQGKGQGSCNQ